MKILHTSDWHLGRSLNRFLLIEDQACVLEQLLETIRKEAVDVLIIAGDIYDKSIPNEAAVELFNRFLSKVILEEHVSVMAISGNHDSNERIQFGSELFESQNLYIIGKDAKGYKRITLQKDDEEIDFYLLPYMEPAEVREIAEDESIRRHNESVGYLVDSIKKEKRDVPTILIAHAFVTGGDVSDSERRLSVVGGAELVDANHFKDFTYTALGHLHKKQAMGGAHIRYSGSLLKYSISEANQDKGFVLLEVDRDGKVNIEERSLRPLRDVRILKGTAQELITNGSLDEHKEDYIYARVFGEYVQDITAKLRQIYPNILGSEWIQEEAKIEVKELESSEQTAFLDAKERTITEVFMEFLDVVADTTFDEEETSYIESIIKEIEEAKDET